jgi:hypothetical protein
MTSYAYDPAQRHLVAVTPRGAGATARTVARLHESTDEQLGLRLAHQLPLLSTEAWLHYTDADRAGPVPAQAALAGLRKPNRAANGQLRVEPDWVVQRGHEVGRTLVEIGSAGVRRAVTDDVIDELASVDRALLGDLEGRAAQAVELTRLDALPVQVAVADSLLREAPSGCDTLLTGVEPTAACVAAAHWTTAALDVTLEAIGSHDDRDVFYVDTSVNPFDTVAPRALATWIRDGASPQAAVQRLIRPAMEAARGVVPDPEGCVVPGLITLDPGRPARHLLDRLLQALVTCRRVYIDRRGVHDGNDDFDRDVRFEATRTAERLSM